MCDPKRMSRILSTLPPPCFITWGIRASPSVWVAAASDGFGLCSGCSVGLMLDLLRAQRCHDLTRFIRRITSPGSGFYKSVHVLSPEIHRQAVDGLLFRWVHLDL